MRVLLPILAVVMMLATPTTSSAGLITVSLPDFDGPFNDAGFPVDLGTVGTFNFLVPAGEEIASASFSGTYGTEEVPESTAGFNAVIGGQTIVVCVPNDAGCWQDGAPFRPFSFGLNPSTFATLATGQVGLQIIQTNEFSVRLGTPTLTINTRPAPEPATLLLLGAGLGLGALRRRQTRNR
jgi:hypothetical protein